VETVATARVPFEEVTSPGKVMANPNRTAHVAVPVAGRITKVSVKIGDPVRQGDPLLWLESPDVDATMSSYLQAQAGLTQARAGLVKAQADVERARDLYQHKAVAQKEVLNAESLFAQAKAAVEQAEAGAQQWLRRIEILGLKPGEFGQQLIVRSPLAGKVLEMSVVPGEYRNDTSAPLITIADLSTVWVTADVPESAIRLIQRGEKVEAEFAAYPGERFNGRVTQIADTVDPQTRTIQVRAEMVNADGRLRPEMFCRIRHVDSLRDLPVVPASAIVQGNNQNIVYVETAPGTFRPTPVRLDGRAGDRVGVVEGLQAGDRIAVDGVMLLHGMS